MSTINLATASKDNPTVADFLKFRARIESHEELYRKADNADPGDNVSLSGNLRDLDMMPGIVRIAGTPNDGGTSHKGTLTYDLDTGKTITFTSISEYGSKDTDHYTSRQLEHKSDGTVERYREISELAEPDKPGIVRVQDIQFTLNTGSTMLICDKTEWLY